MSHTPGNCMLAPLDGAIWIMTPDRPVTIAHAEDTDDDADRLVACWNACAGLTDEQVAAIPRLIAWFRGHTVDKAGFLRELAALEAIFTPATEGDNADGR